MSSTHIPFIIDPQHLVPIGSTQMPIVVLMVDDQPFLAQGVKRMLDKDVQILSVTLTKLIPLLCSLF